MTEEPGRCKVNEETDNSLPKLSSRGNSTLDHKPETSTLTNIKELGPYRVLREIARGGMGVVYLAIQQKPVERQIALKVIRNPLWSSTIVEECKSLAAMSHPNVAVIFDGGVDPNSQISYFAMEFVDGHPLTQYCKDKALTVKERLEIFVQLCNGVQHAHKKQIIHKDLKPDNVLVIERDGKAIPKIIDFGVSADLQHKTSTNKLSGTWEYMSPEQAAGKQLDTQTDIYSLAVILYQLLTGQLPLDRSQFLRTRDIAATVANVEHINKQVPPKASERFNTKELASLFFQTCPDRAASHRKSLQNDFDFILAKGLNKDPELRYDSANGFAEDIIRVMQHEVPLARPFSRSYTLKKFVRRNLASVAMISLLFLVSLSGAIVSTALWRKSVEYGNKVTIARDAEEFAKENAEKEAANANFQLGNYLASQNRILESKRAFSRVPQKHRGIEWWLNQKTIDSSDFTCFAHTALVSEVCFSPLGRWVASAGRDAKVTVWDVETGCIHRLLPHDSPVVSVDFHPCDTKLVTATEEGELGIWDAVEGKRLYQFSFPSGTNTSLVLFDWEGEKVVVGADDKVVTWDYKNGTLSNRFQHSAEVTAICLSPDGETAASSSRNQDIQVWKLKTGELISSPGIEYRSPWEKGALESDWNHVVSMDFSPDGKELAFAIASSFGSRPAKNLKNLGVWDFEERTSQQIKAHENGSSGVRYSPDGLSLISVGYDNQVRMWNHDLKQMGAKSGHGQAIESLDISADGSRLVTAGGAPLQSEYQKPGNVPCDYGVKFWSLKNGVGSHLVSGSGIEVIRDCKMTADGSRAFILNGEILRIVEVDKGTEKIVRLSGQAISITLSDRENKLAILFDDGRLVVLDSTGALNSLQEISTGKAVQKISFAKNGESVLIAYSESSERKTKFSLACYDLSGEKKQYIGSTEDAVVAIIGYDANSCITVSKDKKIRTWDLLQCSETRCVDIDAPHGQKVGPACLAPNHQILAVAIGAEIELFDIDTGKRLNSISGHKAPVTSLEFSVKTASKEPSNHLTLISAGEDFSIRIWDIATGNELHNFDTGKAIASDLFVSNQAKFSWLSNRGDLHLFGFSKDTLVTRLYGHRFPVFAVEFSDAEPKLLYSRSKKTEWSNEEWFVWQVVTGKLLSVDDLKALELRGQDIRLKPEFEFVKLKPGGKCAECQISENGDWTAVPTGNEVVLVKRPAPSTFEALSRKTKAQVDSDWHYKKGADAEKDGEHFAAAFHYSWAMINNSNADLKERYSIMVESIAPKIKLMLPKLPPDN